MKDHIVNTGTATKMFFQWGLGIGEKNRYFVNDRAANAMRNSFGIKKAREDFYKYHKTFGSYSFGISGLLKAGIDPIEQYVGSYTYNIIVNEEGGFLQYNIYNETSFSSFDYHITPSRWNWNSGPMSTTSQYYIFTEPIR